MVSCSNGAIEESRTALGHVDGNAELRQIVTSWRRIRDRSVGLSWLPDGPLLVRSHAHDR